MTTTTTRFNPRPIFPVGPISEAASHQIAKLDHIASALAGRHATVNCWSNHDWTRLQAWRRKHRYGTAVGLGYSTTGRIDLAPLVCEALAQVLAKSADQPLVTAYAVTVLAHESAHASGIHAENQAECRAIRGDSRAARLLGLSKKTAAKLPHIYRGTLYPYDERAYRTPPCPAGLPGVVAPDTLGSVADLRPLQQTATAVARTLRGWKNLGGVYALAPLSPCALLKSRTFERARFQEFLSGPGGELLDFGTVRVATRREFVALVKRDRKLESCLVAVDDRAERKSHSQRTFSRGRIPRAFVHLSPDVHASREIFRAHGHKWTRDDIVIFDSVHLGFVGLYFDFVRAGTPIAQELGATRAALQALR